MPHLKKICISTLVAIATIVTSMPLAHSGTTSPQYLARRTSSLGTFRTKAACRARGRRLVRAGVIRGYRCLRRGKVWKLRPASDSDRNSGIYGVSRRRIQSQKYRTTRTTRRTSRRTTYRRYRGRYRSMAACRARGRALVRAGKISSFTCTPTL
jgi:hypothetical protein